MQLQQKREEPWEEEAHSLLVWICLGEQMCCLQGGDVSHLNKPSISAVRAQQTTTASNPALKLLQILLPLLVILAAIFVPKYLL